MLTIQGCQNLACQGWSRRELIQAGGMGLFGVSLPRVLAAEETVAPFRNGSAKQVIFLLLFGGPSQLETFDMKPEAPTDIRGPFRPIASRTPGLHICEHLSRTAAVSDKFAVIRTMNHPYNDHGSVHYIQTGHPHPSRFGPRPGEAPVGPDEWPSMGSVVNYLSLHRDPQRQTTMPDYTYVPNRLGALQGIDRPGQYAGWLGSAYNALATDIRKRDKKDNPYFRECTDAELDFRIRGILSHDEIRIDRLDRRRSLLEQFESQRRALDNTGVVGQYARVRQRAIDLATSPRMQAALDIRRESASLRDRYGRHLFGQSVLMGRRLLEAGSRFVTVAWDTPDGLSWDSHSSSADLKNHLVPGFDQAYSALLTDMQDRGLLDETLVVVCGEMGRTPKKYGNWGRSHWTYCFPAILAGGGIRGGITYGTSDKQTGYPIDKPVSPEQMAATIFHAMGIHPQTRIADRQGRPAALVHNADPLTDLFS